MAAYRRVYDSRHLEADIQEPGSAPEPYTLGKRVWVTFTSLTIDAYETTRLVTNYYRPAFYFFPSNGPQLSWAQAFHQLNPALSLTPQSQKFRRRVYNTIFR